MLYTLSMLLVQPLQTEMNFSSKYSLHVQSLVQTKTLTIKFVESKHYRKAAEALIQVIVSVKMDSKAFGIWYTYQLEYAREELLEVLSV